MDEKKTTTDEVTIYGQSCEYKQRILWRNQRKEIEKAVGLAIKDASTVPTIVKILFGGTTITLASAIIYIAYRQDSPWSPTTSIPLFSFEHEPSSMPKEYFLVKKLNNTSWNS